jgi:hypothetical protein
VKKKRKKEVREKLKKNKHKHKRKFEAYLKAGESGGVALVVSSALWRRCHRKREIGFPSPSLLLH